MITVLEDLGMHQKKGKTTRTYRLFKVQCECGKIFETFDAKRIKYCKVCGNKKAGKKREKHGLYNHRLKSIYYSMLSRCYNINHKNYSMYGGKGITVCDEWRNSFESFVVWSFSNGYIDNFELDKDYLCESLQIKPKIYSPQTCRWISKSENSKSNKRQSTNSKLSYEDVKIIYKLYTSKLATAKQLAQQYNVDITTIYWNIKHYPNRD